MTPAEDYDIGFTGARFGGAPRKRRKRRAEAVEVTPRTADEEDTAAIAVVRPAQAAVAPAPAPEVPAEPAGFHEVPEVGYTGARFGGSSRRRRDKEANPEPIRVVPEPVLLPPLPAAQEEPYEPRDEAGRSLAVRPYFYTRGRTRSRYELAIETLVSTQAAALTRPELAEHRHLLDLCREPRSVAEIGALLGMPLGVARVVVGDLAVTGALEVHSTVAAEGPDVALMERVLAGLRRL
ncbi:DUF742 domain-containing protein [Pseudonocardia xishanensis]|uniref:DUF742 domain-containing protein n=1 Tax=Pseudonocardia xishanensis TaxID=630995 RepID=A0ABP8RF24_9PSEU